MRMDLSADHTAWDQTEQVNWEQTTRKTPRSIPLTVAKRSSVRSRQQSPSGGVYVGAEINWRVPARLVPAGEMPKPADVIVDSEDTRWTVLTVERKRLQQTWLLGCVNLTLALDLRETILVERATIGYDGAGAASKSFPPHGGRVLYTAQARVQYTEGEVAEGRGVRAQRERYEVIVDRQMPDVDVAEDRVRWVDRGVTRYLDIVAYRRPERIDELPVLECEERS